jgi:hypothetical protein
MFKHALTSVAMATALLSGAAFAGGPEIPVAPECEHCFRPFVGIYYTYTRINHNNWWNNGGSFTFYDFYNNYYFNWSGGSSNRSFNDIEFEWGAKYGPYFGFAFGIDYLFRRTTNVNVNFYSRTIFDGSLVASANSNFSITRSYNNYYAEARGYWPIGEGFDLIGAIGADILHGTHSWSWNNWNGVTFFAGVPVANTAVIVNNLGSSNVLWNGNGHWNSRSHTTVAWRFGVGADYMFTPNWGIQAMFHYMPTLSENHNSNTNWNNNNNGNWNNNNNNNNNNFWSIDAGLFYLFS